MLPVPFDEFSILEQFFVKFCLLLLQFVKHYILFSDWMHGYAWSHLESPQLRGYPMSAMLIFNFSAPVHRCILFLNPSMDVKDKPWGQRRGEMSGTPHDEGAEGWCILNSQDSLSKHGLMLLWRILYKNVKMWKKKCEKNACSEGLGGVSALLSAQSVVKLGPAFCLHLPMVLWKVQVQELVSTNSNPCSGWYLSLPHVA